jgi:molybdopterin converting factor small subunit
LVRVRYFASLRERRGRDEEMVALRPGESLEQLYVRLFPAGPEGFLPVAYARNAAVARGTDRPEDGDEVAFLPPVGGG